MSNGQQGGAYCPLRQSMALQHCSDAEKFIFLQFCCKSNILLSIGATYCVSIKFIFWLSIDCIALRLWGGIRASDPPLCLVPPHLRFDPNATGKVCVGDFYHRGVHMSIVPDRWWKDNIVLIKNFRNCKTNDKYDAGGFAPSPLSLVWRAAISLKLQETTPSVECE